MFTISIGSALAVVQLIWHKHPLLALQDCPPPFGTRFSPFCPSTHNAPQSKDQLWNPADTLGFLVSLTALIVNSSEKIAWHRLCAWQQLNANVGAPFSRGIYIQIPPHCAASVPIGQRASGISTPSTLSLASVLCFWATECPRSGIMSVYALNHFHKPTLHRKTWLSVLSLYYSLAFTESVGDFIFEIWLFFFFRWVFVIPITGRRWP